MKAGYKNKTGTFGTDGEWYAASLFQMAKQERGARLPDLLSVKGTYSPEAVIEVKSGLKGKGVLVEYQLHYEVQSKQDYRKIFGEDPPEREDSLPQLGVPQLSEVRKPLYYDVLCRTDDVPSDNINTAFSAVQLTWGDQYLVPGEFGFWAFATARSIRTGQPIKNIAEELKQIMQKNILDESSHYQNSKGSQSWQDIHSRDIAALFYNDPALATKDGQERIKRIRANYKDLSTLVPIEIDGPNHTKIRALALPEDRDLFDVQLRRTIEARTPIIEKITRARKAATPLLKLLPISHDDGAMYGNGEVPKKSLQKKLTGIERRRLERLAKWLGVREHPLSLREEIPI